MVSRCVFVLIEAKNSRIKLKRKQPGLFQASFLEQNFGGKDFQLVPQSALVAGLGVLVEYNDIRALGLGLKNNLACGRYLQKCSCNLWSRPHCVQRSNGGGGGAMSGRNQSVWPWCVSPHQHDLDETQALKPTESRKKHLHAVYADKIMILWKLRGEKKVGRN